MDPVKARGADKDEFGMIVRLNLPTLEKRVGPIVGLE